MAPPQMPFFMDGLCEDLGYVNTRDLPCAIEHKRFVEDLWCRFHHLADTHFREDARNHFSQRFWEMYLAVALLEHRFKLNHESDEGPEFCASVRNSHIWFEAIAPGPGMGDDRVPPIDSDGGGEVPIENILLRFTNAFDEKRKKYAGALDKRIVSPEDHYVLAINSEGIWHAPDHPSIPYFVQALLGFGPPTALIDTKSFEVIDSFHQYQPEVTKLSGASVSTNIFLDQDASFCSAVLHSGADCANHPEHLGGDFSVLHNPSAQHPLDDAVFDWCKQYFYRNGRLVLQKAEGSS